MTVLIRLKDGVHLVIEVENLVHPVRSNSERGKVGSPVDSRRDKESHSSPALPKGTISLTWNTSSKSGEPAPPAAPPKGLRHAAQGASRLRRSISKSIPARSKIIRQQPKLGCYVSQLREMIWEQRKPTGR